MTKIYAQGNYIVIEANNERNTFPKKGVGFKIVDEDGIYSLSSQELPIGDFDYSEVKKEDGSDYTTALEFETFLFENTGNFNSGADGSPNHIPLIEVTYDELVNLKNTFSLVKGQNYLLTDYETTYTQPVTNASKSSGVIEPLIITATDVDKLHNQCKSTLYPQDIVYYEITGDIGNDYGTEGFTKGKIYRRIDTLRNNDIGTDWRHVKYDRDGEDKLLFEDYNEFYSDCYNNVIKTYFLFNNVIGNGFNSNTIWNNFAGNTIGNNFNSNTIGNGFISNTIVSSFINNTIANYFNNNTIGDFMGSIAGDNFEINGTALNPFNSINTEFKHNINNVTSSTEIQNPNIDVVVFKSPNGTKKQRYYDDSNNLVINNL